MQLPTNTPFQENIQSIATEKLVVVSNPTTAAFLGWIPTTISFAKGERTDLTGYGSLSRPYQWHVLKKWQDGSIALAQIKMPFFLTPGEMAQEQLLASNNALKSFVLHPDLGNAANIINSSLVLSCTVNGAQAHALPMLGQLKVLRADPGSLIYRTRCYFTQGVPAIGTPLSLTTYVTIETLNPVVQFQFVLGNDSLEMPISGGLLINNLNVNCQYPMWLQNDASFGNKNVTLADGQTLALKYFLSASSDQTFSSTAQARSQCELVGFEWYGEYKRTHALLNGFELPAPRFDVLSTISVKNQIDSQVSFPIAQPKDYLGHICQNPPNTGAQPDFASGMPVALLKSLQCYSTKQFGRVLLSVYRECFRPSFYWDSINGIMERCRLSTYPNLFFWGSRPHFDSSWNAEYPAWISRSGNYNPGNFDNWGGYDNQHWSINHLQACYELTGDPYLEDVLTYYGSLIAFDFFTKWQPNIEAERGTRTLKCAYGLAHFLPALLPLANDKHEIFKTAVTQRLALSNIAGCCPFDGCDPRVNNGLSGWCPSEVAVGWQTGFHMEVEAMLDQSVADLRYLDFVDKYFTEAGTPITYFQFAAPATQQLGGIGVSWWAGWVMLASKYPNLPGSQFILTHVKPIIDADQVPQPGQFFCDNDNWKSW
jgi:hypothetical protein